MKFKVGDEVKVVTGKEKGKTGKVEKVFPQQDLVLVANINTYKRHKKRRTAREKSEIITIIKPLPVAKVALICPKCHVQTRIGFVTQNDTKVRVCKKCNQVL